MLRALVGALAGRMERKAKKRETAHLRERRLGLRLRGHARAIGFAAGDQRNTRQHARGFAHRGTDRRLRALG